MSVDVMVLKFVHWFESVTFKLMIRLGFSPFILQVWSLSQNCSILDLPLHYDWVMCVKFSPSGSHILSSSYPVGIIKVRTFCHVICMSCDLYVM